MLIKKRKNFLLTGTLLILLAYGCQHTVKTIPKVELSRTPEIQFNLRNETSGSLRILPAQDETSGTPVELMPGAGTRLTFRWVRIANLENTDYSWMRPVAGSEANLIITDDPVRYIDMQGEDGLIQMRNAQGRLWKLLLDIESCLEQENVVEEIIIKGPPDSVMPTPLCE